jgi:hypothetical protein
LRRRVLSPAGHVSGGAIYLPSVDLALQLPAPAQAPLVLSAMSRIEDLPPYIAEVVEAVATGVQISKEFARTRGMSITNASEHFREARRLSCIVPVDGRYPSCQGIRRASATASSPSCPWCLDRRLNQGSWRASGRG